MLNSYNWVTILFNNSIVNELAFINIKGTLIMYVVLYVVVSTVAIVGGLVYSALRLINATTNILLHFSALLPDCLFRFFSVRLVTLLNDVSKRTDWELLELYNFVYTYKYKQKYYEVVPEEWLPYLGVRGIRRFLAWRKLSWENWKANTVQRQLARARIYKIFRKPLKRRARVLYRVLNKGYKILVSVIKGKKPIRVLRRWCIRVSRRWRRLWRWWRRNIKRNLYRLRSYITITVTTNYVNGVHYYYNNKSSVWPINQTQGNYTLLFFVWSFLVRIVTVLLLVLLLIVI